jgi:uncharacterized Zn-finger protein
MKKRIVVSVLGFALLGLACAEGKKESKQPAETGAGPVIQCPYCKAVYKF